MLRPIYLVFWGMCAVVSMRILLSSLLSSSSSNCNPKLEDYAALKSNYSALVAAHAKLQSQLIKATRSPTPPPVVPTDAWYQSVRTWATAASHRAWGEFECVGPDVDPNASARHALTADLWQQLGLRRCGCLHLCELPKFNWTTCNVNTPVCRKRNLPLWIMFVGDSTFRYWFTSLKSILNLKEISLNAKRRDLNSSLDDENRWQGVYGLDEDFDAGSSTFVVSHRALWGTQTSKLLSALKRPHVHRIKPYFSDPKTDSGPRQAHQGVLDEPLFVEGASGLPADLVQCGPDLVISGFGFWDIISLVVPSGAMTGNAERDRCGLDRGGVGFKLFPSRLVTLLNWACALFGRERFLLRTLNLGEIEGGFYPVEKINEPMKGRAAEFGIAVLDFFKVAQSRGDKRVDTTHVQEFIAIQAVCQAIIWLRGRQNLEDNKKDIISGLIKELANKVPNALCLEAKGEFVID